MDDQTRGFVDDDQLVVLLGGAVRRSGVCALGDTGVLVPLQYTRRVPTEVPTIEQAIEQALPGTIIIVARGTYHLRAPLLIEKQIRIRGEGLPNEVSLLFTTSNGIVVGAGGYALLSSLSINCLHNNVGRDAPFGGGSGSSGSFGACVRGADARLRRAMRQAYTDPMRSHADIRAATAVYAKYRDAQGLANACLASADARRAEAAGDAKVRVAMESLPWAPGYPGAVSAARAEYAQAVVIYELLLQHREMYDGRRQSTVHTALREQCRAGASRADEWAARLTL